MQIPRYQSHMLLNMQRGGERKTSTTIDARERRGVAHQIGRAGAWDAVGGVGRVPLDEPRRGAEDEGIHLRGSTAE